MSGCSRMRVRYSTRSEVMIARQDLMPPPSKTNTPHSSNAMQQLAAGLHRKGAQITRSQDHINRASGFRNQDMARFPSRSTLGNSKFYSIHRPTKGRGVQAVNCNQKALKPISTPCLIHHTHPPFSQFHNLAYKILPIHRVALLHLQICNLARVWSTDDHFLSLGLARHLLHTSF